jgi:hypothetical protein
MFVEGANLDVCERPLHSYRLEKGARRFGIFGNEALECANGGKCGAREHAWRTDIA